MTDYTNKTTLCVILFVLHNFIIHVSAFAQNEDPALPDNTQTLKNAEVLREMDQGVILMESGAYENADKKFRYALSNLEVVPSKLVFYIGKNSFYLNQYKQSIDWLNKYIELKGTKGQYYVESVTIRKEAEQKYLLMSQKNTPDSTLTTSKDSVQRVDDDDCTDNKKIICPVCKGKTVIIEEGRLGKSYKLCPYSDEHGHLTCNEYYLLLQGKLKPKF